MHLPGFFGDGRFKGAMQNVAGPTLVAMATKFGLGAEIQSPTGLLILLLFILLFALNPSIVSVTIMLERHKSISSDHQKTAVHRYKTFLILNIMIKEL